MWKFLRRNFFSFSSLHPLSLLLSPTDLVFFILSSFILKILACKRQESTIRIACWPGDSVRKFGASLWNCSAVTRSCLKIMQILGFDVVFMCDVLSIVVNSSDLNCHQIHVKIVTAILSCWTHRRVEKS